MAITQKLREIGGIINSTDLNYNFNRMQEDLQLAVEGVVFNEKYSQVETMADRNTIPEHNLTAGLWVAVSENGRVYEYNTKQDITFSIINRDFGLSGDLPLVPYIIEGEASSGIAFDSKYTCDANSRDLDWKYTSAISGFTFNDGDVATYRRIDDTNQGEWVKISKWVEIMDVTSILENNLIGKLEDLHTEDKSRIVNAINEVHDDLGTLENLTTTEKTTAVAAINELDTRAGELEDLTTSNKENLVSAINEVDKNLGPVEILTTVGKTATTAINELDKEVGNLSALKTDTKENIVSSMNEVHDDLGTLNSLTTAEKDSAVDAINELDGRVGKLPTLTTTDKRSIIGAINELDAEIGPLSSLSTTAKNDTVSAINEIKLITDSLRGATIIIGRIDLDTEDVTPAALTTRALEIMGGTKVQAGWTLIDKEQHEWHWNGKNWQDMEQPNIYPAQNNTLGMVRGSAAGDVSITDGNMTVLHSQNSGQLNGQSSSYYATASEVETKADKSNVLEKDNTVAFTPSADYHPTTKKYVDAKARGAEWGYITGEISSQEDLKGQLDSRPVKTDVLTKTNTTAFNPTADYHPATKKYVDNAFAEGASWGQIQGELTDQRDLKEALDDKQDLATAWNHNNLVVGTEQPAIPATGYILWVDTNE